MTLMRWAGGGRLEPIRIEDALFRGPVSGTPVNWIGLLLWEFDGQNVRVYIIGFY